MTNMIYALVGGIHLAVHTDENPTQAEWEAYLADIGSKLPQIQGILAVTHGAGPDGKMRQTANAFWAKQSRKPPIAVLTSSGFTRAAANALSWVMGDQIKAFKLEDTEGGFRHLRLPPERRAEVLAGVAELRSRLGLKV